MITSDNHNLTISRGRELFDIRLCTSNDSDANCNLETNNYTGNMAAYGSDMGSFPAYITYSLNDTGDTGAAISTDGYNLRLAPG